MKQVAQLIKKGEGTVQIMAMSNDKVKVAANGVDAMFGVLDVPISALINVKKETINEKFYKRG